MLNVIITGANSFIGKNFIAQTNYKITEIDLLKTKAEEIDFNNINVVFHVAAIVHQDKSIPESKYFEVNSDLAYNIAKVAREAGVKQFIFMSTIKVYGENTLKNSPWAENSVCNPIDAYGRSKLEAENKIRSLSDENFIISIIRTPVVYGPGVKGNILKMASFVKNQKFIPFRGINNKRAMVYVKNLIALIDQIIIKQKSGLFLASDGKMISTSEFIQFLINGLDKKKKFVKFPTILQYLLKSVKPNLYNRLFGSVEIDSSKTFAELDFIPPYSIESGLEEVIQSV